jgi:tRNA(adenine34) deaminase
MNDQLFMREALKEAEKAYALGEVPVGAVLVSGGKILSRAHNLVETLQDATAHAEVLCLRAASQVIENWRLVDVTLYSTLEPCSMCAGAMFLSRISTLVWGARDKRHGAHGSWVNLLDQSHPIHQLQVRRGVLEEEASVLMVNFFRSRRREHGSVI